MKFYLRLLAVYSVLATVLIAVLVWQNYQMKRHLQPNPIDWTRLYPVQADQAPTLGPENARVTVVAFLNFDCRYCGQSLDVLQQLVEAYPETIRVAVKHIPGDSQSRAVEATKVALAAHVQGKFWEMQRFLFEHSQDLGEQLYADAAGNLNLDREAFQNDRNNELWESYLQSDREEAEKLGITGTPTFFVNGMKVTGARYPSLERVVKHWLSKPLPHES